MAIKILHGDARAVLRTVPTGSINCIVTSPPYYNLRDYFTGTWEGGDAECAHLVRENPEFQVLSSTLGGGKKTTGHSQEGFRGSCPRCGAIRIDKQIGMESSLQEYIDTLVKVFRQCRRVLREDGVMFLNLGDSYAGSTKGGNPEAGSKQGTNKGSQSVGVLYGMSPEEKEAESRRIVAGNASLYAAGLKPKDLLGVPWSVAFALRADGWWLRSDIIQYKLNPMPESINDRPTSAHEHIFLLSKSQRYYFDAEAVREPGSENPVTVARKGYADKGMVGAKDLYGTSHGQSGGGGFEKGDTRNIRNVWPTVLEPFPGAHFATMAPSVVETCIMAGSPKDGYILDPFGGAGTTGLVADRLGRHALLIELSEQYIEIAAHRLRRDAGMYLDLSIDSGLTREPMEDPSKPK